MNKQEVLDFIRNHPMGLNHEGLLNNNQQIAVELDNFLDILLDEGEIQKLIIYPKNGKTQCIIFGEETSIMVLRNDKVETMMIGQE